jgi:hypothetical protein
MSLRVRGRLLAIVALAATPPVATLLVPIAAAQPYASPPSASLPDVQPNSPATTTPVHAVSLHIGPSGNAPVIGTLRPGMPLEILGTANYGWVEVRSSIGTGWAYGSYLAGGARGPQVMYDGERGGNAGDTGRAYDGQLPVSGGAAKPASGGQLLSGARGPYVGDLPGGARGFGRPSGTDQGGNASAIEPPGSQAAAATGAPANDDRRGLASQINSP